MKWIDTEVLATFIEEAEERLTSVESGLLRLEKNLANRDVDLLRDIFREAHSLKATSNLLGFQDIETVAHHLENTLEQMRQGQLEPSEQVISDLLAHVDSMRAHVARLK
ncbi:MAG: Hpt domain-containing protein [Proteobacteria bacterium]|nr:Hpt domain-containing protein [Pseudomonadota bacterium]